MTLRKVEIVYIGSDRDGEDMTGKVATVVSNGGLRPEHPTLGAASAESKRRVRKGKAKGSRHPMQARRSK